MDIKELIDKFLYCIDNGDIKNSEEYLNEIEKVLDL